MRRMIPQKLIDKLVAQLEREEQTKEILKNITVAPGDDISAYNINLASDGYMYLTIIVEADIDVEDETNIELQNIPTNFFATLTGTGTQFHLATNSLGSSEAIGVKKNLDCIVLTISEGAPRTVYSTITLTSVIKEL